MTENIEFKHENNTDKKFYAILNYGCQMNESDAEHYAGQLEELGYARTEDLVRADVILVVQNGAIREQGTHEELIRRRGAYYRLYARQYEIEKNTF